MASNGLASANDRRESREDVHYRTDAIAAPSGPIHVVVVNISPSGLMARCDPMPAPGDTITFRLPGLAALPATVRWALGGRIGCEFQRTIPAPAYFALVPRLK